METMSNEKFVLVGMRFSKYFYDEDVIRSSAKDRKVVGEYEIGLDEAEVSEHKYKDRKVIELRATISFNVSVDPDEGGKKKSRKGEKGAKNQKALSLTCVAGFVGKEELDDGNLQEFLTNAGIYGRAIYWLARQRVRNITTSTLLNTADLPWDLGALPKPEVQASQR